MWFNYQLCGSDGDILDATPSHGDGVYGPVRLPEMNPERIVGAREEALALGVVGDASERKEDNV